MFNAEEYLNLDNDVHMFSSASNDDILVGLISGDQSDEKEAVGYSQNKIEISPEDVISLFNILQDFVAIVPHVLTCI